MDNSGVPFKVALRFWAKLGFISFGGPAGQIAIMHKELVEQKRWISEGQFLRALNFCMLLPGPEAQQLATYIGWRLHGTLGGIVAGSLFVIPSIFVLLFLSWLAAAHGSVPVIAGMFYGIQPVVIAIVFEAVLRIGKRALHHPMLLIFAGAAFMAISFLSIHFPWVIAAAGLSGFALQRRYPHIFLPKKQTHQIESKDSDPENNASAPAYHHLLRALKISAVFLVLWALPAAGLWLWRGGSDVLVKEALFFTKAAFVTFGGAYAVLSYIAEIAVNHYLWLDAAQMVHGLGLAESTPGPLIMVTQYVGFMGAWKFHGAFSPLFNGILGALVTTYVTFLPCFFMIFLGAPYIESLAGNKRLQAALTGITSAVVGVILSLAVFFSGRVLLADHGRLDLFALVLASLSFLVLKRFSMPVQYLVPMGAVAGMIWTLLIRLV